MRNIVDIYNESRYLKQFEFTESKNVFYKIIKDKKEIYFIIPEYNLYPHINDLIIPLFKILNNVTPNLYMREDVVYKDHWCEFDRVFKSKHVLVHIINNEIYIERVGSKDISNIIDFAVISRQYIMYNNNKKRR